MTDAWKNTGDEIPENPGEFAIRQVQQGGQTGPYFYFACPRGRGLCGVPLQPSPPNPNGCSWRWDGNRDAPTISPSINCNGKGGCGWHQTIVAGAPR